MIINNQEIKNTHFIITQIIPPKLYDESQIIEDLQSHEYAKLANYHKESFEFIRFKDEEVIIKDLAGRCYRIFGKCRQGMFGIDQGDKVWLIAYDSNDFDGQVCLNHSLIQFRKCYCLLLSYLFLLDSQAFSNEALVQLAIEFREGVIAVDANALNSFFYKQYIQHIKSANTLSKFELADYLNSGRYFLDE